MLYRALILIVCWVGPADALVGGAPAADGTPAGRSVVLIVGSRGNSCTGTAIARDLVLTAAHCVLPGADYKLVEFDGARQPILRDVVEIARHPDFKLDSLLAHRATADVALLKLAGPLPGAVVPAPLAARASVNVDDRFTIAGNGVTVRGDGRTGGTVRTAALAATGRPGTLQIRLVDPATRGERPGLGACTGDSGGPAFEEDGGRFAIIGVVSWSTGPGGAAGCGGLTGVTPLVLYRNWIIETARRLGSALEK